MKNQFKVRSSNKNYVYKLKFNLRKYYLLQKEKKFQEKPQKIQRVFNLNFLVSSALKIVFFSFIRTYLVFY